MSARSRPPTDEPKTKVFDPKHPRSKQPTQRGHDGAAQLAPPKRPETPAERAAREKEAHRRRAIELATPTEISPRERSEPLRVISMKTPAERATEKQALGAKQHYVQLRALSEVTPTSTPLGNLAPPHNPKEARGRRVRDGLIWGSAVVIVGCVVMLGIWFLAGR